jgi:ABC-type antimicrobial peptide transport system permease subunit
MALGAGRATIYWQVLSQATRLSLSGCGIGLLMAPVAARGLRSNLYGVSSFDPVTLLVVLVLLIGAAFLAAYWPARRAAKVDPMVALRYE